MKKVRVSDPYQTIKPRWSANKDKYSVSLGDGNSLDFTNKEKAEAATAALSAFWTEKMLQFNFLLADVNKVYRQIWPYLETGRNSSHYFRQMEKDCDKAIAVTEHHLKRLTTGYLTENRNAFCFASFVAVYASLATVLALSIRFYERRPAAAERARILFLVGQNKQIIREVRRYGKDRHSSFERPVRLNVKK